MHCQNADWATQFLLHKFNITARDSLVGTDFGKYVKYKRPERRGGKTFLSGKSWKTTHDPWRGLSRTSFGLDYLKYYSCPEAQSAKREDVKEKMMELNYYDKDDNPRYGWDVYVQRMYVFSECLFPLLNRVLSPEMCLGGIYSADLFQGLLYTLRQARLTSKL